MDTIAIRDQLIAGVLNDTISEEKVNLILKIIDKFNRLTLKAASVVVEKQATKQEQIEEAKQRLESGETVREVSQDIPERVVREVSRSIRTQDVREMPANNVREVVRKEDEPKEQESEPEEDKPILEVATYRAEDEKAIAMKRLAGLTGLKRAAMAAAIERYFRDRQTFEDVYRDDPSMKFAYTLDDYINGARYNIGNS